MSGKHSNSSSARTAKSRAEYARQASEGDSRYKRERHPGRVVGIVILCVVVIVGAFAGSVAYKLYGQAKEVKGYAKEIAGQKDTLAKALKSGDADALQKSTDLIVDDTDRIYAITHNDLWNLATNVPVVGSDIQSAQTLSLVATNLVNDALVPVMKSASGIKLSQLVKDGSVDVTILQQMSSSLETAIPVVKASAQTIEGLPEPKTDQLKSVMDKIKDPLGKADGILDQAEPLVRLLPQMLGADGQTRNYLLIAQNNAELRSTGGLPGSWVTLSVTNGTISMGESTSILHQEGLQVEETEEEAAVILTNMDTDPAQMNCTANFPRVGQMASEYWEQAGYSAVDGVVAIDPVFLQSLLALTGPITGPDGTTIDGTNCAKVLLSDVYWKYRKSNDAQDAYFAAVASEAFKSVLGNLSKPSVGDLVSTLQAAGNEGRLLMWMRNEDEEALIWSLGFAGQIMDDPMHPVLGVYVNDDTYSKITWYAGVSTTIGEAVTNADGTITYPVTTVISNTITPAEAANAPVYVSGGNSDKRSVGDMLSYPFLYGPAGGTITDVTVDEGTIDPGDPIVHGTMYGLDVYRFHTHTGVGRTSTITYNVNCVAGSAPLALRTTPLAQPDLMVNSAPGTVEGSSALELLKDVVA